MALPRLPMGGLDGWLCMTFRMGTSSQKKGFEQSLLDTQTRQVPAGLISVVKNKLEVLGKE